MKAAGLTFIELLIVLVVIGAGWFALLPRLDMAKGHEQGQLTAVNTLLARAGQQAVRSGTKQHIRIQLGQNEIKWKKEKAELPGTASKVAINGRQVYGVQAGLFIYPTGHMDELHLWLVHGAHLCAQPLAKRLTFIAR